MFVFFYRVQNFQQIYIYMPNDVTAGQIVVCIWTTSKFPVAVHIGNHEYPHQKKSMPDKTPLSHISQYFSVDVNFIWLQFSHYSQSTELYECIMSYIGHIHGFYCMEFYCSVQMSACVVVERSLIIYFRYFVTKQS